MSGACLRLGSVLLGALALTGTALAGSPSPADGGSAPAHVAGPSLFSALFALSTDLSDVGFAGELATGPSAAAYPDSDGDDLLIVDDGADCPNAEYLTIQAAVNAAGPGDRIKVCPGEYREQVTIPAGKDGITLYSEGRAFEGQTGLAEIDHNLIDRYQKGGVVGDNSGSYGNVHHNEIVGVGPQPVIGQNGIQVSRGATADVDHNEVYDNVYTLGGAGTGIILFQANGTGPDGRLQRRLP